VRYAFPLFAAHAQFVKEYGQFSYYLPLTAHSVFAFSSRLGFIQGIGPTGTETCADTESCVPLTERFTAGGESTHRAYPLDMLGDLCEEGSPAGCKPTLVDAIGTISPIGGLSMFIANLEYRFPIAGSVGGTLFTDAGNVFADQRIKFGQLRYGAGGGIRYLSPIGPLRFDIGYKIHKRQYESPYAYFLTFGYAF
jgi:outer membrane protein assembly factor BamA